MFKISLTLSKTHHPPSWFFEAEVCDEGIISKSGGNASQSKSPGAERSKLKESATAAATAFFTFCKSLWVTLFPSTSHFAPPPVPSSCHRARTAHGCCVRYGICARISSGPAESADLGCQKWGVRIPPKLPSSSLHGSTLERIKGSNFPQRDRTRHPTHQGVPSCPAAKLHWQLSNCPPDSTARFGPRMHDSCGDNRSHPVELS